MSLVKLSCRLLFEWNRLHTGVAPLCILQTNAFLSITINCASGFIWIGTDNTLVLEWLKNCERKTELSMCCCDLVSG